ncbi:MAG: hypothetical protein ACLFTK_15865, partial [Anaerolineales bacterium]
NDLERASVYFQTGYPSHPDISGYLPTDYNTALSLYGDGFVHYRRGEYAASRDLLLSATRYFFAHKAAMMTAMCLQLIAATCQKLGDLDEALTFAHNGISQQELAPNPVQHYHLMRRMLKLQRQRGIRPALVTYGWRYFLARTRANKWHARGAAQ